ncbi:hypothetical protein ACOSP7_002516 [Xanthoceras sorbifolium]|uniref:Receptor-like serine/threonine-protein kinase n=1 Tax=Xanthoceras sorbifolium TaxID=99658 RepID=A0ABQ8GZB4_9ROSI|nr:hypothetical protein JRO89_XSUnG0179200 [Xanthoceras sorbifolium]
MDIKKLPWFMFSVFFICFSFKSHVSTEAADTIAANQSLSGDQTVVSAGGVFVLGFFKPGNSSNYYIGIWYKKVSPQTVVWVANRDKPISDRFSSVLRFTNGNLVLFNESQKQIWSTNLNSTTTTTTSIEAVLLNEGNLVLRDRSKNMSEHLWESFDHPTNTWLPGMKFGQNKRTKVNQLLTSWKNIEDPATGLFSLELHPDGSDQYVIVWNRSQLYWNSGTWNGQIFSLVPEMVYLINNSVYNFGYVADENERYFIYSVNDPKLITQFIIDSSGQIKQMYWLEASKSWFIFWSQPRQPCEVYAYCGPFGSCNEQTQPFCGCLQGFKPTSEYNWNLLQDYSGGCVRKTQLQCGNSNLTNGKHDRFLANGKMVLPKNPKFVPVGSIKECEATCLNNCSCSAYSYENGACSIWIKKLLGLQKLAQGNTNGKTIYIKLAASEVPSANNNKGRVIGGAGGSVALVVILGLITFVYLRRRKRTIKATKPVEGSLMAFSYKDLQNATKNFSEKLGGGGFGSVFRGVLHDSSVIAVKKLESVSQGEKQFRTEVSTIGNIQHVNLIRLLGFCCEGNRKLLVYDYMPYGSLDVFLFHGKDSNLPDWKARYQITMGIARGLAYLHEKCRDCIIHCDIKPENILLDAEFCPKVADFGLAKLFGREFSRVLTTIRGTRGYLAPEWISGVAITAKADVYSYGMMLFEIVSGRRNCKHSEDETVDFFPTRAASIIADGSDVLSLLDPRLEGNADAEELSRICKVACWCVQDDESHRPSMGQVVQILEGVLEVDNPPIPRSLQLFVKSQEFIVFFTESSSGQSSQTMCNNPAA